ncbi:hypothetical protein ACO0QE_001683 [Hanseniaspora vineae]
MESEGKVQFSLPFQFFVEPSFYSELRNKKLHKLKLTTDEIPIQCSVNNNGQTTLAQNSFDVATTNTKSEMLCLKGFVKNFNTLEEFKNLNKPEYLESHSRWMFEEDTALDDLCSSFYLISFAELKKYTLIYWISFPVFQFVGTTFKINNLQYTSDSNELKNCSEKLSGKFVYKDSKCLLVRQLGRCNGKLPVFVKSIISKLFYHTKKTSFSIKMVSHTQIASMDIDLKLSNPEISLSDLRVTGWSRNSSGKLSPKFIDLSNMLDPLKMNEQSVDLNLKLMKWRIQPDLDLDVIQSQKILLLGSGTLGCYIARALLAWGVKNITFVDNGKVSHSNPVRQPLFNFDDVGKNKAQAAMENLKKVFPAVFSTFHVLEIPMIGHPIVDEAAQKKHYSELEQLIKTHDVIFLLMDSRETRWLPTVIGKANGKLVMNAALGFDSYLVLRHGDSVNGLGCYFCNDIVAPADSLKDRTLDQMCTVTRPGCALMAASLAVEMMVSYLQTNNNTNANCLGDPTPHQIRGFLNNFTNVCLETPQYNHCSACSFPVTSAYLQDGWAFVQAALDNPKIVEDLSGLTQVQEDAERRLEELDLSEFDDFPENDSNEDFEQV